MTTCTKQWTDIPFAHRSPKHDGHCKTVHGHNWSIEATFGLDPHDGHLDANGFVVDFGKLKGFKDYLERRFDHALVLNESDPLAEDLMKFLTLHGINNVVLVPDCSCEGLAKLFFKALNEIVTELTEGRARVVRLTLYEDSKNWATYTREAA